MLGNVLASLRSVPILPIRPRTNWSSPMLPNWFHDSFKSFRSRISPKIKRQREKGVSFRPDLEHLESRLAPTVSASLSSGTLTVTLDAANDFAQLSGAPGHGIA